MSDEHLDIQYLLDRPIAYHRIFVDVAGSVPSAVFLSQAMYWQRRVPDGRNGWFYKSTAQWSDETGLTRYHIQTARKSLEKLGVMEFELRDFPRRTWYRLNVARLREVILSCREQKVESILTSTNTSLLKTTKSSLLNPTDHSQLNITNSSSVKPTNRRKSPSDHSSPDTTNNSKLDSTHSLLDSTNQFTSKQQTDLTEITNKKTKKYNFAGSEEFSVDNFFPTERDRAHFENLPLSEPLELVLMEFRLYHRELGTATRDTRAWSKLFRGWCDVRAHGLPYHPTQY